MHVRELPGRPDIVFEKRKTAIFIDGCFWHGCKRCYRRPKSNQRYWDAKIANNRRRDRRQGKQLKAMGWACVRFWEHEVNADLPGCMAALRRFLGAK